MQRKGLFITIEGTRGSGKTRLTRALERRLIGANVAKVLRTSDGSGSTPAVSLCAFLTRYRGELEPLTVAMVEAAARVEQVQKQVIPGLQNGTVVLSDQFADTGYAQHAADAPQGQNGWQFVHLVESLNARAVGHATPDVTILLDGEAETFSGRGKPSADTTPQQKATDLALQQRARDAYLLRAEQESSRFYVLDATQSPEEVEAAAWSVVKSYLRRRGIRFDEDPEPEEEERPENARAGAKEGRTGTEAASGDSGAGQRPARGKRREERRQEGKGRK